MTDTEQKRIKAICKVAHVDDISDLSDGYHTFKQLYYQRMILFATLVKQNRDKAWKSFKHSDGELCFGGGWFIVGVDTPQGSYTYHYEKKYWDMFDCKELQCGKEWDGHTEEDVTRLLSLEQEPKTGHWITTRTFMHDGEFYCDRCKYDSPQNEKWDYCPNCGAKMVEPQESEEVNDKRRSN